MMAALMATIKIILTELTRMTKAVLAALTILETAIMTAPLGMITNADNFNERTNGDAKDTDMGKVGPDAIP